MSGDADWFCDYLGELKMACAIRTRLVSKGIDIEPLLDALEPFFLLTEWHQASKDNIGVLCQMNSIYKMYYCIVTRQLMQTIEYKLAEDDLKRHVIMTECKLASGKWIDVMQMLHAPHKFAMKLPDNLDKMLDKCDAKTIVNIKKTVQNLQIWLGERELHNQWSPRILGINFRIKPSHAKTNSLMSGSSVHTMRPRLSLGSVESWMTPPHSSIGSGQFCSQSSSSILQTEEEVRRILFLQPVKYGSYRHRLCVITPKELLLCSPESIMANLKSYLVEGFQHVPLYKVRKRMPLSELRLDHYICCQEEDCVQDDTGTTWWWNPVSKWSSIGFDKDETLREALAAIKDALS